MRVAVVGGGVSGLSAALFLQDGGADVTLYEASDRLGGSLSTQRDDGLILERGPDSFVRSKPASIELCERLGIDMIGTRKVPHPGASIVRGGQLLPLPQGLQLLAPTRMLPFLLSPVLSWRGKLRVALDLLLPRRKGASGDDDETLAALVRRRLGNEALDRLAQPLVGGIYSGDPERLSLRATMPRLLDLEQEHRSLILGLRRTSRVAAAGARYELFQTPESGMQTLVDALEEALELGGAKVERSARVDSLESLEAERTVLALPAAAAAELLGGGLAEELRGIPTTGSATVNLVWATDELPPLRGYGFVVPAVEERFVMACTFSSNKYEGRSDPERQVLRAFVGGALGPDISTLSDEELVEGARRDLSELLGIRAQPQRSLVTRYARAQPQYELGHLDRVARIEAAVAEQADLELVGNSYRGVGVSDCIRSARGAADRILAST